VTSLLDGGLARLIGRSVNNLMLDGVLTRGVSTTADERGNPEETDEDYPLRGFTEGYSATYRAVAGIPSTDLAVNIIAASIATTPKIDDRVTMRGTTYRIRSVTTDPAQAMWVCQAFEVSG
jgi:hypothetical protein